MTRALLFAALLGGCADPAPEEVPEAEERGRYEPGVPLPELVDAVIAPPRGVERPRVLDRLGEPRTVETEIRHNRHDPSQTDRVRTLHYDGLSVRIYDVTGGKEMVQDLLVTGAAYETEEGIGVGSSRAEVRDAWGEPDTAEGDAWTWETGELPMRRVVRFDGDEVRALAWHAPVD